jgi:hypothetical protein
MTFRFVCVVVFVCVWLSFLLIRAKYPTATHLQNLGENYQHENVTIVVGTAHLRTSFKDKEPLTRALGARCFYLP